MSPKQFSWVHQNSEVTKRSAIGDVITFADADADVDTDIGALKPKAKNRIREKEEKERKEATFYDSKKFFEKSFE